MVPNRYRLGAQEDEVVNLENLLAFKRFILRRGQTCTWCQMFNNNPCWETAGFNFYLNPDPGGPYGHPQFNINCDPAAGDFSTLVIRRKLTSSTTEAEFRDQYRFIDFSDPRCLVMRLEENSPVPPKAAWNLPRQALREALDSMGRAEQS
jgi:hypothetical protein